MNVDDKLAKEKLARAIEATTERPMYKWDRKMILKSAELIRNTDLTDCQQKDERMNEAAADTRTPEQLRIAHLEHEIEMLTNAGVIECAVRNKAVAEYMRHWEGRALKAEGFIAPAPDQGSVRNATELARLFHDTYERLAPSFGYVTRTDTRQFDPESPNGRLMIAVCAEIMRSIDAANL